MKPASTQHLKLASRATYTLSAFAVLCTNVAAQPDRPLQPLADSLEPSRKVVYKTIGKQSLEMHIFEPPGHRASDRRPVFLAIHGGGWTGGSVRQFYPFAHHFAQQGMVGISLEYRLMDRTAGTTVFDCVRDGRSAVRYIRENAQSLGINEAEVIVAGGSAGGHIAAGTALFDGVDEATDRTEVSCRPDLLVLYYPVIDTSAEGYGQQKIGTQWRKLSPVDQVKEGMPPTILFHGTADTLTPYAGAQRFVKKMLAAGNVCEFVRHPGGKHGYLIFDLLQYEQALVRTQKFIAAHSIGSTVAPGDEATGDAAAREVLSLSLNLSGTWVETPWATPVIDRGAQGEWDHLAVDNPYVHVEGEKYCCFFEGQDKSVAAGGHERCGLAVSEDGRHWRKLAVNPILDVGPRGAWDSIVAKLPAGVVWRDGLYHLFYSGRDDTTKQIGLATAPALTGPWTKAADNPVLGSRPDMWDAFLSTYPAPVFEIDGRYFLLFRGMKTRYRSQGSGLAVGSGLRNWRRIQEGPVIPVSAEMASLAVARANGGFVGISQPTDGGRHRYWHSRDLMEWRKGSPVNFRASGTVDTLSNPYVADGRWTVLYEQADRIYRAVLE